MAAERRVHACLQSSDSRARFTRASDCVYWLQVAKRSGASVNSLADALKAKADVQNFSVSQVSLTSLNQAISLAPDRTTPFGATEGTAAIIAVASFCVRHDLRDSARSCPATICRNICAIISMDSSPPATDGETGVSLAASTTTGCAKSALTNLRYIDSVPSGRFVGVKFSGSSLHKGEYSSPYSTAAMELLRWRSC